jgi:hypothetical protein
MLFYGNFIGLTRLTYLAYIMFPTLAHNYKLGVAATKKQPVDGHVQDYLKIIDVVPGASCNLRADGSVVPFLADTSAQEAVWILVRQ